MTEDEAKRQIMELATAAFAAMSMLPNNQGMAEAERVVQRVIDESEFPWNQFRIIPREPSEAEKSSRNYRIEVGLPRELAKELGLLSDAVSGFSIYMD